MNSKNDKKSQIEGKKVVDNTKPSLPTDNQNSTNNSDSSNTDIKAPVFTSPSTVKIKENKIDVLTVKVSDESAVTYSLGGSDASDFDIDVNTGKLTFKNAPDYEKKSSYSITIIVKDSAGNKTSQNLSIKISDVYETVADTKAPVFTSPSSFEVKENQIDVGTIKASDESGMVVYFLSGSDKDNFKLNPKSGKLTFKTAPDYEKKSSYSITIIAKDKAGNKSTQKLIIKISDIDENPSTPPSSSSSEFLGLLKTGQTTSYQDYDDGYYQKGISRNYTRGAGIVTDHVTGLQWQDDYSDTSGIIADRTWKNAKTYCANLSLGGYSDWRLPSVDELLSIVDNSKYDPAISNVFEKSTSYGYWSSTLYAYDDSYAWCVHFHGGDTYRDYNNVDRNFTRCVRAGQ